MASRPPVGHHRHARPDHQSSAAPDRANDGAFFTPAEARNADQAHTIKTSDTLVDELIAADVVVIAAPMYNFSVPSTLKAWIDHIARVGRTFKYGANGPEGQLAGKKVYVFT